VPLSGVRSLRRLRSIGELKVLMHGPMKFVNSVLSPEGQAAQEELAAKRAAMHANKRPGRKATNAVGGTPATEAEQGQTLKKDDVSVPAPPLPSSPAITAAAAA